MSTPSRDEAPLKGAPVPPPPPDPPLHGSKDEEEQGQQQQEERHHKGLGVGGEHEGRTPGKPQALKPSHWDELVHPKDAADSAAVRNRDAKKQGHTKKYEF